MPALSRLSVASPEQAERAGVTVGCSRFNRWIATSSAGLATEEKRELEHHLADCADCRELVQLLDTATAAVTAPYEQLPDFPEVDATLYLKQRLLGTGGMGETFLAFERRLGRPVALKEPRADTTLGGSGFEREARLTARLQHPAIVSVYEAGRFAEDRPFYAMRVVDGAPLDDEIERRPTLEGRLTLVPYIATVAQAIAYAHDHRVVHRDLKPANMVIGRFGEVVVVDWGLASDLDDPIERGGVSGTPAYMAPEQAIGEPPEEGNDIYAIGATLYHVLAGKPPYSGSKTPLRDVLQSAPAPLGSTVRGVPRDLLAIVDKAMARDRAKRYATAAELADDLSRFLTGRLVSAYEYGRGERAMRWVKRHRVPVAIAALGVVASGVVAAASIYQIVQAREDAQARADELVLWCARDLLGSDPTAALAWLQDYPSDGPGVREVREIAAEAANLGVARHVFASNERAVAHIALSADEKWIASAGADGTVRIWSSATGAERILFRGTSPMRRVAFSPDGGRIAAASADGLLHLIELASRNHRDGLGSERSINALAWSSDGKLIATGGQDRVVRVWEATTLIPVEYETGWEIHDVAFAPDSKQLAIGGRGEAVVVWDLERDSKILHTHEEVPDSGDTFSVSFSTDGALAAAGRGFVCTWRHPLEEAGRCHGTKGVVRHARFSSRGDLLAYGDERGGVWLWQWQQDPEPALLTAHRGSIIDVRFTGTGSALVVGALDGAVELWDIASRRSRMLVGHRDVKHLAVGGSTILSASHDRTIRVWAVEVEPVLQLEGKPITASDATWLPDGTLVTVEPDGTVRTWRDLSADTSHRWPYAATKPWRQLAAIDNRTIAAVGNDSLVHTLDIKTGRSIDLKGHKGEVMDVAVFAGGRIVTSSIDKTVRVSSLQEPNGTEACRHDGGIWSLAISNDRPHIAAGGYDGRVTWSAPEASSCRHVLGTHEGSVNTVAISRDGSVVVSGGVDEVVAVWLTTTGQKVKHPGHRGEVKRVAVSGDGTRVFSGGQDGTVRAWPLEEGKGTIIAHHRAPVTSLVVSPDGRFVASGSPDGKVFLLDLERANSVRVFTLDDKVTRVAFSPDSKSLAIVGGSVQIWPVAVVHGAPGSTSARVTSDDRIATPAEKGR